MNASTNNGVFIARFSPSSFHDLHCGLINVYAFIDRSLSLNWDRPFYMYSAYFLYSVDSTRQRVFVFVGEFGARTIMWVGDGIVIHFI